LRDMYQMIRATCSCAASVAQEHSHEFGGHTCGTCRFDSRVLESSPKL
jgi:hypothetical protein